MIPMTLAEIAEVVGGRVEGAATVSGAAFLDSRFPVPGGLFVAIAGARSDGHDHAPGAVAGGAAAVLASRSTGAPSVIVDDVVRALSDLAAHVVAQVPSALVVAITGSQGKTGVKDYTASVLAAHGETVATAGNNNNELGVPLTVLRVEPGTRHLVVEMGARGIGHIAHLCAIAPPDVAVVTNVGTSHLGEFGSQDAIALAKGEIVEALAPDGIAVLNGADERVAAMASRTSARTRTFDARGDGEAGGADVEAREVSVDDFGRYSFDLVADGHAARVSLAQIGRHQVDNALAAASVALAAGMDLRAIARALGDARPASRMRMEVHDRADGLVVVNDAYNANPESMSAAVDALADMGRSGRRTIAVLGEMYELGPSSSSGHRRVGERAAQRGIDVILGVGPLAGDIVAGAESSVEFTGLALAVAGRDEARTWLRDNVSAADVVLVKASRGAALEMLVDSMIEEGTTAE